jgi:hypothetical protein
MAARVHVRSRATHEENPKGLAFPVWDAGADEERHYIGAGSRRDVEELITEHLRDYGPTTQYALWLIVQAAGHEDPRQVKTSGALIKLRTDGEIKSDRDGLARRTPRSKPFFSALWELT